MRNKGFVVGALLAVAFPAFGVEHPLVDPAQEARAYAIFHQIRCAVCQSESLADSPADVATDMRQAIRIRVAAGDTDADIKKFLVGRYGDSIIFLTPITVATAALWFGPAAMLLLAIAWIAFSLKKAKK